MQVVAVDILGPLLKSSNGSQCIFVAGDYFTQLMKTYSIPNQEADTYPYHMDPLTLVHTFTCAN